LKKITAHGISFILIAVLAILTVATQETVDEVVYNSLTYEMRDGHFYIRIVTEYDAKDYQFVANGFYLYFKERVETQYIYTVPDENGKYIVRLQARDEKGKIVNEEILLLDEPCFKVSAENNLFIIRVDGEIIKYDNCYINRVVLLDKYGRSISYHT